MPTPTLPLALLALANATAPDRALRAPTLEPAHDQSPRERAALATPERAAHTVLALTLLHTTSEFVWFEHVYMQTPRSHTAR